MPPSIFLEAFLFLFFIEIYTGGGGGGGGHLTTEGCVIRAGRDGTTPKCDAAPAAWPRAGMRRQDVLPAVSSSFCYCLRLLHPSGPPST